MQLLQSELSDCTEKIDKLQVEKEQQEVEEIFILI